MPQRVVLYPRAVIDFDQNATTPVHPEVAEFLAKLYRDTAGHGNPSSVHGRGRKARAWLEEARRRLAATVGASALELTFTSGGTEADQLAIRGAARALRKAGAPSGVLSSPVEHAAVRDALVRLEAEGHPVVRVRPDGCGRFAIDALVAAVDAAPEVGLVSLAHANHELGNFYALDAWVPALREGHRDLLIHSDAVQAFGKRPLDFAALDLDMMSLSSHKVRGPKGIGALVHRAHTKIEGLWGGGKQERGRRTGTEDPIAALGFALAAELAVSALAARAARVEPLRDRLLEGLRKLSGVDILGDLDAHVGNTLCATFEGCEGELLMMNLDLEGICVSTGSACSVGTVGASEVLLGLGLAPARARSALRFSLGPDNDAAQVDRLLSLLPGIVDRVRGEARA